MLCLIQTIAISFRRETLIGSFKQRSVCSREQRRGSFFGISTTTRWICYIPHRNWGQRRENQRERYFHTDIGFLCSIAGVPGVRSLKEIQEVMSNQSLRFFFPFSQFSFNTEIVFLMLVEGRRSPFFTVESLHVSMYLANSLVHIQQTDTSLPLQPQNKDISQLYKDEPEIKMPDRGQLDIFRNLLSNARRGEKPRVPKQLTEVRQIEK